MSEDKKSKVNKERDNKSSVGFGTSIGLSLGGVFGILSDKLTLGIVIGIVVGAAIDLVRRK